MADVVYYVKDLLFSSKIRETASQAGVSVEPFRDVEKLVEAAASAKLIILDLRLPEALAVLERLAAAPKTRTVKSVGFIDHEKVELMEQASAKGCHRVLAKGRFTSELAQLMGELS